MTEAVVNYIDGENGLTNKIKQALFKAANDFVYIGFLLNEANNMKYYEQKGYSSIYEYAEVELNFKRTSTKNFMAVAETFGDGSMTLQKKYSDYGYSQLTEMLAMTPAKREDVKPNMTVKQIRQMKQQAAEELKADKYTIPEVVEASGTLVEEPAQKPKPESAAGQTSDQKETVIINNIWKEMPKETLEELAKISGIGKKKIYDIRIKGKDENCFQGIRYYPIWVSVDERMPDEEEIVLVCAKTKSGHRSINRAYYSNNSWHGSGSMAGVTHWMMMPDLPEE